MNNVITINNTENYMTLDFNIVETMLEPYKFTADRYVEEDGSITLCLNEIDLAENGKDDEDALKLLAAGILDFAEDFYKEFDLWARGWRKA